MSWITDWCSGVWEALVTDNLEPLLLKIGTVVFGHTIPTAPGPYGAEYRRILSKIEAEGLVGKGAQAIMSLVSAIKGIGDAAAQLALERQRAALCRGENIVPVGAEVVASLLTHNSGAKRFVAEMNDLFAGRKDKLAALWETVRTKVDIQAVAELWRRGNINETQVDQLLKELGYVDTAYLFDSYDPTTRGEPPTGPREDMKNLKKLFQLLPDLDAVIVMELRDCFPLDLDQYPPESKDEQWQLWAAETGAHNPLARTWEQGHGQDITDALKEGSDYGPQSFASWFLGARQMMSPTFQSVAKARGLDPYWAMKVWESHWKLPDWYMARELLFRSPKMTPKRFEDMLRWQDFPPGLIGEMVKVAYEPITRIDVRRMHLRGVIGADRVFKAYLELGYNTENAANMTAFVIVLNADSKWGNVLDQISKAYIDSLIDEDEAVRQYLDVVAAELPSVLSPEVAATLSVEQQASVLACFDRTRDALAVYLSEQLTLAQYKYQFGLLEKHSDAAHDLYTSWRWDEQTTRNYLAGYGFATGRVNTLMEEWEPERTKKEKLPTQSMLEDFLHQQLMSVDQWYQYMQKLGYSEATIEAVLQGTATLPTVSMLERFLKDGVITENDYRTYMSKLGYSAGVINTSLEAIRAENPPKP